jgi:hypothetical protein
MFLSLLRIEFGPANDRPVRLLLLLLLLLLTKLERLKCHC